MRIDDRLWTVLSFLTNLWIFLNVCVYFSASLVLLWYNSTTLYMLSYVLLFTYLINFGEMMSVKNSYPGFPNGSEGKESACNAGDPGSIPELGRCPGEGNSYPLQYSALYSPQGAKSQTRLSDFHVHLSETQFSHLYNGCGKTPSLTGLLWKSIKIKKST